MSTQTRLAVADVVAATFLGCDRGLTYDEINGIWHKYGAADAPVPRSVWYYAGSDDRSHYFFCLYVSQSPRGLSPSDIAAEPKAWKPEGRGPACVRLPVRKSEIVVEGAFPPTGKRSEWKRVDVPLESSRAPGDVHFPRTLNSAE